MITKYIIDDISCEACKRSITNKLQKENIDVDINLLTKQAVLRYENISDEKLRKILDSTGYHFIKTRKKENVNYFSIIIPIILSIFLVFISMVNLNIEYKIFVILQILLLMPSIYFNYPYIKKGIKSINMYTLIQLGVFSSIIYSIFLIFQKSRHLYFETASVVIAFQILGHYIEQKVTSKTNEGLNILLDSKPSKITCLENGKEIEKNILDINVGDVFISKTGNIIELDGKIVEGQIFIDESIITGESYIIEKNIGDFVISGTKTIKGYAKISAITDSKTSNYSKMIDLISDSINKKPKISKITDTISKYFIFTVLFIALITGIYWYFVSKNDMFIHVVSVLVIACPCAIGLAIPTVIVRMVYLATNNQILIRNPEVIEEIQKVDNIFFDKTGTLTTGNISVNKFLLDDEYINELYSLEKKSEHILSNAIVKYIEKNYKVEIVDNSFTVDVGYGIKSNKMFIGNISYMEKNNIKIKYLSEYENETNNGNIFIFISNNEEVIGYIVLSDTIRKQSRELIQNLQKMGKTVHMLTGDNEKTAMYISKQLGIKNIYANLKPDDKLRIISSYQKDNKKVLMVGDGVNDAAALSQSNVSVVISNASDISIYTSDIILLNQDILGILKLFKLSNVTMNYVYQNLLLSSIYNIIGIFLATGMFKVTLTPMFAAFAMMFSSISVMLNTFRMKIK